VQHYVEGLPRAEGAACLGVSEGAVTVRLHWGRLAVRCPLARNGGFDATAYGYHAPADDRIDVQLPVLPDA